MNIDIGKCEKKVDQFYFLKTMHTHTHNMETKRMKCIIKDVMET